MKVEKFVVGVLLPGALIAGLAVPWIAFRNDLPDPIASNFDASGTPNSSASPGQFLLFAGLSLVLPGVLMLLGAAWLSPRMPRPMPPLLAGMGALLGTLGSAIVVDTFVSQRGLASWTEAELGASFVLVLLAALVGGAVGALTARRLPYNRNSTAFAAPESTHESDPHLDVKAEEKAVYVETMTATWALWLAIALLVIALVLAFVANWVIAVVVALSTLPVLLLVAFRVQVDQRGIVIRSALFGIPFVTLPIDEIERAAILDVEPMKWGGWGYRGSLKLAGTAALVLRRGPGVHLTLDGDRVFVFTIDGNETAAGLLNAYGKH